MMTIFEDKKPQDVGYHMFFTSKPMDDTDVVSMQYARATANRIKGLSDPEAIKNIKDDYFAGPMHFGSKVERRTDHKFFDIDMKNAYATWLLAYSEKKFDYRVGGNKRYYSGNSYFRHLTKGLRVYKIRFSVKTEGRENSRIYRRWFLKTTKVNKIVMTDERIMGIVQIPDIDGLVNRFIDEVYFYEKRDLKIDSIIVSNGASNVYINTERLREALGHKNNPANPFSKEYKLMINASTGFLAHADKVMYYTMVNQVRSELFKLWDVINRWNEERPDMPITIVAANTDGFTVYAHKNAKYAINDILTYRVNPYTVFNFILKKEYDFENAHFTPNDIREAKYGEETNTEALDN